MIEVAQRTRALIDAGTLGAAARGKPDPDWDSWSGGGVDVSLDATRGHALGGRWVRATIQLALERDDTPPEGLPEDTERDLRVARDGSAVARCYLAGKERLADAVVEVLARDEDTTVVVALAVGDSQRRVDEGHHRPRT